MLLEEPQGRNCIKNYDLNLWKTRWLRWLCYLHKVLSTKLPTYLYELIPPIINFFCNPGCYRALYCRTDLFQNSFLPFSINKWNKLDPDIRNLDSHKMFCKKLFNFIRPSKKSIFNVYDPQRFKLPSRLRLGFSHLCEHKFWYNFADTVNLFSWDWKHRSFFSMMQKLCIILYSPYEWIKLY